MSDHPSIRHTPLVDSVLTQPKGAYKWQKKYDPAINEYIPALYQGGRTDAQVAARIGIAKCTFYLWIKQYPAFADAVQYGKTLAEDYTTQIGFDALEKERKINDKVWHTLMRNCYGYDRDVVDPKDEEEKNRIEQINNRTAEIMNGET